MTLGRKSDGTGSWVIILRARFDRLDTYLEERGYILMGNGRRDD